MKRIAVSLGSLSLILSQNASAESSDQLVSASPEIAENFQDEMRQDSLDMDVYSSEEIAGQELDDDLVALEEELDIDFEFEEPADELSLDIETESTDVSEHNETITSLTEAEADPILADSSLEQTHEPLTVLQASKNSEEISMPAKAEPVIAEKNQVAMNHDKLDLIESEDELSEDFIESSEVSEVKENLEQDVSVEKNEMASSSDVSTSITSSVKLSEKFSHKPIEINVGQIFAGSPIIYLILFGLSIISVTLWLFNLITLKKFAFTNLFLIKNVRNKLMSNQYDEVMSICKADSSFFAKMMLSAVSSRKYGLQFMLESMKSEGKRASVSFWQRLSIIHDIAIVAPLIGLLGTVLGMLYAFYDLNRSIESISSLFDGLGVSVGTTVSGIFVAILAMILHSISKYRLVKSLTFVENEAVALAHLIDNKQQ